MVNRKKRLKRGIESIQEEIELHDEKRKQALEEDKLELADYYDAEIEGLKKSKISKEEKFRKS